MRKLVRKDADGFLTEADPRALRREALALRAYIAAAPAAEEAQYQYGRRLTPLVEAALAGRLDIPSKAQPYDPRLILEGLAPALPPALRPLYAAFLLRIRGEPSLSSASVAEFGEYRPGACERIVGGRRYEWVVFEDEEP